MINLLSICVIFSISISPHNIYLEHYYIIPPLGRIYSITASTRYLFVASDNYLIFFNKPDLSFEKALMFDRTLELIAYDQSTDDIWLISLPEIVRFTPFTYSIKTFPFSRVVNRLAVDSKYLYLDTGTKYCLDKRTGKLKTVSSFPPGLYWNEKDPSPLLKKYTFLTPYYYFDQEKESQIPFQRYPITALYDDGINLFVGTDRFGLLKYNKVSWQYQRIIYGPLDSQIDKVYQIDSIIHFLSAGGISYFQAQKRKWHYLRLKQRPENILWMDKEFVLSFENRLLKLNGTFTFPLGNFQGRVLCLNQDTQNIYIGTTQGLFRLPIRANEPLPFGLKDFAIYVIHPTEDKIYIGGENGFYRYDKKSKTWSRPISFGIKDIVSIGHNLYLLGLNNQLISYQSDASDSDTTWFLLPYFNIYDITTDQEVLYCASYSGVYYYNPQSSSYQIVHQLPRIKYDYVFFVGDKLIAIADKKIYALSEEYLH
ncbi:hypothetical protein BXT86_04785 [candidate division WOR-3 bacterium 4484_100]|uniref:Uncharacterized protein n=1 Tax=candidate division WOR-3 bacterium 4484_100 TaxID=1936077 RepID=A0A1V4QEJ7_UNCW3|nr:MAG: hypothetical protein BXT86_04785 [candidate division WOR-3 bacterium 4484_100]